VAGQRHPPPASRGVGYVAAIVHAPTEAHRGRAP
jgi:hypothetical protein